MYVVMHQNHTPPKKLVKIQENWKQVYSGSILWKRSCLSLYFMCLLKFMPDPISIPSRSAWSVVFRPQISLAESMIYGPQITDFYLFCLKLGDILTHFYGFFNSQIRGRYIWVVTQKYEVLYHQRTYRKNKCRKPQCYQILEDNLVQHISK